MNGPSLKNSVFATALLQNPRHPTLTFAEFIQLVTRYGKEYTNVEETK